MNQYWYNSMSKHFTTDYGVEVILVFSGCPPLIF